MSRANFVGLIVGLIAVLALSSARADVRLPKVFGDNMVLQRNRAVPIWGWADAGEKVTVTFGDQARTTTATGKGTWSVALDSMTANREPEELAVTGKNRIVVRNVLVGEVWICAGQSNMEWTVRDSANFEEEIAAANDSEIRQIKIPHAHAIAPCDDISLAEWSVCSPTTVSDYTAVGYYFARELRRSLGVPVGLLNITWHSTRIEPWIPLEGLLAVSDLKTLASTVKAGELETNLSNVDLTDPDHQQATRIYNAMIHPLVPFAIRGTIWYQGESNGGEGMSYYHKMRGLVEGWRGVWKQGDFPFLFAQLSTWQKSDPSNPEGGDGWAFFREVQTRALKISNTGMAVTIDIGSSPDIHPKNKQDVGVRLARWALVPPLGNVTIPSGPLYRSHAIEEGKIRVSFQYAENGLIIGAKTGLEPVRAVDPGRPDARLNCFSISGKDRKWYWADATIDGGTVVVSSPHVPNPVAVRYAYTWTPEGANLYNVDGLPASPFHTDW